MKIMPQANEALQNAELEQITVIDDFTGQETIQYRIPDEIISLTDSEAVETEDDLDAKNQVEIGTDVNGQPYLKEDGTPNNESDGFTEQPLNDGGQELAVDQEVVTPADTDETNLDQYIGQDEDEEEDTVISSTTDYLYNFLKTQGLVQNNKLTISQNLDADEIQKGIEQGIKQAPKVTEEDAVVPFDQGEEKGVYLFNDGQCLMAPATTKTPIQRPQGLDKSIKK
jgi:hypothetical protein